jgi:nucleoside 2-deoxyribosyltransferase
VPSVYLAGPEVFLRDAAEMGAQKKRLCAAYGLEGLFPLDAEPAPPFGRDASTRIFNANLAFMRRCDAVVANLTPFRGPSADAGTIFEVGFAFALKKPVFAYTNVVTPYKDRAAHSCGLVHEGGDARDAAGMAIEDFALFDNLMIAEAIRAQGWDVVARDVAGAGRFTDLGGFEYCLDQAAAYFAGKTASAPTA